MNCNLMVCFHRIYCGQEFPASKLLCKFDNVPKGILVGDGPRILVHDSAGSPAVFFLGDEVEGQSPGAIGKTSSAVSEHFLELGFRDSGRSVASSRQPEVTGGLGVVRRH